MKNIEKTNTPKIKYKKALNQLLIPTFISLLFILHAFQHILLSFVCRSSIQRCCLYRIMAKNIHKIRYLSTGIQIVNRKHMSERMRMNLIQAYSPTFSCNLLQLVVNLLIG